MDANDDGKNDICFTVEGKLRIGKVMNWLSCQRGFIDNEEGASFTDVQALEMLLEPHKKKEPVPVPASAPVPTT